MFGKAIVRGLLAAALVCCVAVAQAVTIETVTVGGLGNGGELSGEGLGPSGYGPDRICGAVNYKYQIGKYEVTAEQYTVFLNAVAKTDTYSLYNANMWNDSAGCKILQSGSSGSYIYSVQREYANRPVNYVSWGDAARFANWLHNNQPGLITPVAQNQYSTEDGAYYLNGATSDPDLLAVTRKATWNWAIASEDEWYKAAYFDLNKGGAGVAGYWKYPTSKDYQCDRDMADGSHNNANFYSSNPFPIDSNTYYLTVGGEFQNSASPYGTFDQGGNVSEWNEAVVNNVNGSYRGVRGGSFLNCVGVLRGSNRCYDLPSWETDDRGFRVAAPWLSMNPHVVIGFGIGAISAHIGFYPGGSKKVYESSSGYETGDYFDANTGGTVSVENINGVQQQHSAGSFLHCSTSMSTDVTQTETVELDPIVAANIEAKIAVMHGSYLPWYERAPIGSGDRLSIVDPTLQKGSRGSYSSVGLLEKAAEEAGLNAGQGFVPDRLEKTTSGTATVAALTPELLYWCSLHPDEVFNAKDMICGVLGLGDFIMTDPLGRRFGFTAADGLIDEIPDMLYTGDGDIEQFLLLNPLEGEYDLQLLGKDSDVLAAISSRSSSSVFDEHLGIGESQTLSIRAVPEPGVLSLLALAALCLAGYARRRKRA